MPTLTLAPPAARPAVAPAGDFGPDTVVLYFGNDWFADNRTSSHHLARQLAGRCRLWYFECPGWRAPRGSSRDLRKVVTKVGRFLRGSRRVEPNVTVRTLFQVPFHRFAAVRRLNQLLVKATVKWDMWRAGVRNPVTWFHVPHVPFLVGSLGEHAAVYYCIDDYAAYPGVDPATMRAMDADTTRRADVVFVASDTLLAGKRAINPNTRVSPHGVEFDHFAQAQDDALPVPPEVAGLAGPVVGFFGLIERFIDLGLIDWLAAERPGWQFVFIGRVAVPEDRLPKRANIHFLGRRPYEHLPGYAKRFDACVIPYKAGDWSYHANPIKLREYLATGKPVVAVDTPQARKFADVVTVASDRAGFLAGLDDAIARGAAPADVARRQARVAGSSWVARADEVVSVLRAVLADKAGGR